MIKNWLVTGDTHGRVMERLSQIDSDKYIPDETAIIILGDAGINYFLNKTDVKNKKSIQASGYTIYCVRGNHEMRPERLPAINCAFDFECAMKRIILILNILSIIKSTNLVITLLLLLKEPIQ